MKIAAEQIVWDGYHEIPDQQDKEDAWDILLSLVDDPVPDEAEPNLWEWEGVPVAGYSITLPSGNGFVPYAPMEDEGTGEEVLRLWPVVWGNV